MLELDEKGGKLRSDGLGELGAPEIAGRESNLEFWGKFPAEFWIEFGGCKRGDEKAEMLLVRRRGLNLGASLKGTVKKKAMVLEKER